MIGIDIFASYFASHEPHIQWGVVERDIKRLVYELFHGVRETIGEWPCSSAYYAVDVILDTEVAPSFDHSSEHFLGKTVLACYVGHTG